MVKAFGSSEIWPCLSNSLLYQKPLFSPFWNTAKEEVKKHDVMPSNKKEINAWQNNSGWILTINDVESKCRRHMCSGRDRSTPLRIPIAECHCEFNRDCIGLWKMMIARTPDYGELKDLLEPRVAEHVTLQSVHNSTIGIRQSNDMLIHQWILNSWDSNNASHPECCISNCT